LPWRKKLPEDAGAKQQKLHEAKWAATRAAHPSNQEAFLLPGWFRGLCRIAYLPVFIFLIVRPTEWSGISASGSDRYFKTRSHDCLCIVRS